MCVPVRNIISRFSFMCNKCILGLLSLRGNKHREGEASSCLFFCICLNRAHTWTEEKASLYPHLGCSLEENPENALGWDVCRLFLTLFTTAPVAWASKPEGQPGWSGVRKPSPHSLSKAYKPSFGFVFKCRQNVSPHLQFLTQENHFIIQSL